MGDGEVVAAHVQKVSHQYTVRYPDHTPREADPNYVDFNHLHREWKKDPDKWQCAIGKHRGDFSECSLDKPLELHHAHIEFALMNDVNLEWLEHDYPGISNPEQLGAWVESADNLVVLCEFHHRGHAGVHVASASDYEGVKYIKGFIQ
jgi:hypothetical protein